MTNQSRGIGNVNSVCSVGIKVNHLKDHSIISQAPPDDMSPNLARSTQQVLADVKECLAVISPCNTTSRPLGAGKRHSDWYLLHL